MERYRLLGIEHGGRESASARVVSREPNKWGVFPLHTFNSGDEVVLAADAQATIAALEQRVKELKQWVQDQSTANLETMRHMDEMQSRAMDAESQLAQRTAELARVRKKLVETKLYIQQERANRDSLVACVNRDVKTIKELRTLILALPKVEGEIAVKHTEVDLSGVWGITLNGYFTFQSALFDSKEEADAYAALLTHRQGME